MDPILQHHHHHQQQQQQRRQNYTQIKRKAKSLANLLNAFRSAALFYPTNRMKRAWVERVLYDISFDRLIEANTNWIEAVQPVRAATVEFCIGLIGVLAYGQRLRDAFRNRPVGDVILPGDEDIGGGGGGGDRNENENDYEQPSSSSSRIVPIAPVVGISRVGYFLLTMYERLRSITLATGSTNDSNDARVEFARKFTLDMCTGIPGLVEGANEAAYDAERDGLVSVSECVRTLKSIGYLNKSMVPSKTMMMENADSSGPFCSDSHHGVYPVFLFGSNYIRMGSDAGVLLQTPPDQPNPPAMVNDEEVRSFIQYLVQFSGGDFVPDQDACRKAAVERYTPVITSLSRNDISLQLTFAMPDGHFYTANVFYLRGGECCTANFRYNRRFLSNACKCSNPLVYWRLVVSVAALDGTEVDVETDTTFSDFVTNAIRAFHHTQAEHRDFDVVRHHVFANQFTGLLFVNYTYDSRLLGGMGFDAIGDPGPENAEVCVLHRWLQEHTTEINWFSYSLHGLIALLSDVPQMLVVYRPIISEAAVQDNGPAIFLNYKTFDDVVAKYVLLTLDTLKNGYDNKMKGVTFKSGDNYWSFCDGAPVRRSMYYSSSSSGGGGGGNIPSWQRAADRFATDFDDDIESDDSDSSGYGPAARYDLFINLQRDVNEIFRQTFFAPSRLFVYADVLSRLGFNVTAVNSPLVLAGQDADAAATRTFIHTDHDDERNSCTVICSSPTVVIDPETGRPVETVRSPTTGLRVLKEPTEQEELRRVLRSDVMDGGGGGGGLVGVFAETVVSLDEFWPGVNAVKISFKHRPLRHVHFVFFTAPDGCQAVRRLTRHGLTALYKFNMRSRPLVPQPVVYTLQQMYVHFHMNHMNETPRL